MFLDEATAGYKLMRKLQTNSLALKNQYSMQKKTLESKYAKCNSKEDYIEFKAFVVKNKQLCERKINGKEIKNKTALRKFISLYDSYLDKVNAKL